MHLWAGSIWNFQAPAARDRDDSVLGPTASTPQNVTMPKSKTSQKAIKSPPPPPPAALAAAKKRRCSWVLRNAPPPPSGDRQSQMWGKVKIDGSTKWVKLEDRR